MLSPLSWCIYCCWYWFVHPCLPAVYLQLLQKLTTFSLLKVNNLRLVHAPSTLYCILLFLTWLLLPMDYLMICNCSSLFWSIWATSQHCTSVALLWHVLYTIYHILIHKSFHLYIVWSPPSMPSYYLSQTLELLCLCLHLFLIQVVVFFWLLELLLQYWLWPAMTLFFTNVQSSNTSASFSWTIMFVHDLDCFSHNWLTIIAISKLCCFILVMKI